ncbi:MAG: oligoendopeptidase F [Verrucomicrobia bacterium]|nr:oligoendopeptidase F [Verrucomicrobiota bacterium]
MGVQAALPVEKTQERVAVPPQSRWNVEALFPSWEEWEKEFQKWGREGDQVHWPEIQALRKGALDNPKKLKELIALTLEIDWNLSKLYTYAHLRHDEDVAEEVAKKAHARAITLLYAFRGETAWIEPELLQLPEDHLHALISASELEEYAFHLEKIVRMKPHTLSAPEEELLALSGNALETASSAFSAFNNADLQFPSIPDSQGVMRELTHGKYQLYMRSPDRILREGAFKTMHQSYRKFENTLCELLQGQIQRHLLEMRSRKYGSCVEAALFPGQIDVAVYKSLIEAVRASLPALHRYIALRKRVLGVEELHLYDLSVPLVKEVEMGMTYEEATGQIIESVAVLGEDYQRALSRGLMDDRWVDRYENARKRSGAYSSGCYDSMPYILMNYHGTFNDAMTLTHEAGHSMHSLLSRKTQPYQYSQYSIFVAEVASTFHEELLLQHLLKQVKTKEEKAYLINQKLDDMRATLLRQTLFAEFELKIHSFVEQRIPLTPALLKQEYRKLSEEYFGPGLILDEEMDIEWARIPHFYYNFYVYQYATGISAAHALVKKVTTEGEDARDRYLQFLSSGCSLYPLDVLALAGVDMRSPEPVRLAMEHFGELVTELDELLRG